MTDHIKNKHPHLSKIFQMIFRSLQSDLCVFLRNYWDSISVSLKSSWLRPGHKHMQHLGLSGTFWCLVSQNSQSHTSRKKLQPWVKIFCEELLPGAASIKANGYREHLGTKSGYLQSSFVSRVCFSVFIDQMPVSIPHFSGSRVWCLVISQGFRLSLEDPDTGHENDHEPKLTMAGTAGLTWAAAAENSSVVTCFSFLFFFSLWINEAQCAGKN